MGTCRRFCRGGKSKKAPIRKRKALHKEKKALYIGNNVPHYQGGGEGILLPLTPAKVIILIFVGYVSGGVVCRY